MEKAPAQRPITTSKIANKGWIVVFLFSDRKLTSQKLKLQSSNIQYPISNLLGHVVQGGVGRPPAPVAAHDAEFG